MRPYQARKTVADLHWLATLLTGSAELGVDVVEEAMAAPTDTNRFFAKWMSAWARRIVIVKALAMVRGDLALSALRMESWRRERVTLPPRSWSVDPNTNRSDLERALLSMDVFQRAAVLLLVFENVPLTDAAVMLDSDPEVVRMAQTSGVQELTIQLARAQGWTPDYKAKMPRSGTPRIPRTGEGFYPLQRVAQNPSMS
jgi:DNA-directed RNA polymerase specialized sigma24 family protein